jgi:hypothetical protein
VRSAAAARTARAFTPLSPLPDSIGRDGGAADAGGNENGGGDDDGLDDGDM